MKRPSRESRRALWPENEPALAKKRSWQGFFEFKQLADRQHVGMRHVVERHPWRDNSAHR